MSTLTFLGLGTGAAGLMGVLVAEEEQTESSSGGTGVPVERWEDLRFGGMVGEGMVSDEGRLLMEFLWCGFVEVGGGWMYG